MKNSIVIPALAILLILAFSSPLIADCVDECEVEGDKWCRWSDNDEVWTCVREADGCLYEEFLEYCETAELSPVLEK